MATGQRGELWYNANMGKYVAKIPTTGVYQFYYDYGQHDVTVNTVPIWWGYVYRGNTFYPYGVSLVNNAPVGPYITTNTQYTSDNSTYYYGTRSQSGASQGYEISTNDAPSGADARFASIDDLIYCIEHSVKYTGPAASYSITYQNVNCELSGPTEAAVGSDVSVIVTHGDNFTVATSDIYVTNNGVSVPFTFANGIVTFTMPDPGTST